MGCAASYTLHDFRHQWHVMTCKAVRDKTDKYYYNINILLQYIYIITSLIIYIIITPDYYIPYLHPAWFPTPMACKAVRDKTHKFYYNINISLQYICFITLLIIYIIITPDYYIPYLHPARFPTPMAHSFMQSCTWQNTQILLQYKYIISIYIYIIRIYTFRLLLLIIMYPIYTLHDFRHQWHVILCKAIRDKTHKSYWLLILVKWPEFRWYLSFSDWFGAKRNSVWLYINWKWLIKSSFFDFQN